MLHKFHLKIREVRLLDGKPYDLLTFEELAGHLKMLKPTLYKFVREGNILL